MLPECRTRRHFFVALNYGKEDYLNKTPEQLFAEITANIAVAPEDVSPPDKPVIMLKRIGSTTYQVVVHFSKPSHETMNDKVTRIIRREVESEASGQ